MNLIQKKIYVILCFLLIDALFNGLLLAQTLDKMATDVVKLNVMVTQEINKINTYAGEALCCDFTLLISNELILTDLKPISIPSFQGFKTKEIQIDSLYYTDTLIDGIKFKKALLHRYILSPKNAGKIAIESMKFAIFVKIPIADAMKSVYLEQCPDGYYEFQTNIASNSTNIQVQPLPQYHEKPAFIGDFEVDWSLNKVTAKKNEHILLNINITGIGDLSAVFVPAIDNVGNLKHNIYKSFDTLDYINKELVSKKSFEVDLVSALEGEYEINPVEILCFSPTHKEYYYLRTDAIPMFVTEDIPAKKDNSKLDIFTIAIIVVVLGIIAFVLIAFYYSKRLVNVLKRTSNNTKQNNKRNKKEYRNNRNPLSSDTSMLYLSKAYKLIDGDFDSFLKELCIGIDEYIRDRFQIDKDDLTKEKVVVRLAECGIPLNIAQSYTELYKKIEEVRFSKIKSIAENSLDKQKLFKFVEKYIEELENYV